MEKGLVIKSTGSWYSVLTEDGSVIGCKMRGSFRLKSSSNTNPVAVGDHVQIDREPDGKTGVITFIADRKNYIVRKPSNLSKQYHILAANIDQALLLVTIGFPDTPNEFIDRFLMTAEAYNIPAVLVFNKTDLYDGPLSPLLEELESIYSPIYPCYRTSVTTGAGIPEIALLLKEKVSLITGISGTGKSSLINRIEPGLQLKTGAISDYHLQGKHTTTFYEMFALTGGGFIIDSPGIRGFGLVDMKKDELFHFFPEIFKTAEGCSYYNCLHDTEPGCAVKEALENGLIHPSRYRSYLHILRENDSKYRS
ncbi:MAG: ribosome small subunit-dependent GTPase A [Bacteroidales bacterium]